MSAKAPPPPLPPRDNSAPPSLFEEETPPPYNTLSPPIYPAAGPWSNSDPRSSSTQSLLPEASAQDDDRRRLLLIYIHGFMGNETSFRSFPAHVHHLLTALVADSHMVHTKIYPRYRSKRQISFVRDDFSRWLEPHEDDRTDVVLLGHSMGGLLAAEVVLLPSSQPSSRALKHRIVGTINFDVPFLGMHPGIIRSGLASIFMPSEETHQDHFSQRLSPPAETDQVVRDSIAAASQPPDALWRPEEGDPTFNPAFNNDVILPVRKGWQNALHFVKKHSSNLQELTKATKKLIASHVEFGGAMADYDGLHRRYVRIRSLEEQDPAIRSSVVAGEVTPPRVRFVNYYTASTGKLKKPKSSDSTPDPSEAANTEVVRSSDARNEGESSTVPIVDEPPDAHAEFDKHHDASSILSGSILSTEIAISDDDDQTIGSQDWAEAAESLTIEEPIPIEDPTPTDDMNPTPSSSSLTSPSSSTLSPSTTSTTLSPTPTNSTSLSSLIFPPIPELPSAPPPLDVSYISDPSTRKLVEKEHARATKVYEQAVKDREKALRDRKKLEEKLQAKADKFAAKAEKEVEKARKEMVKAEEKRRKEAEKADEKAHKQLREEELKGLTHEQKEKIRLQKEQERMEAEARRLRGEEPREPPSLSAQTGDRTADKAPTDAAGGGKAAADKPPKDRKFCVLPPKDASGQRDPCWVRVFMQDVDEVGAHCGLFFIDERYERLVGDVADRIEGWVKEDWSERRAAAAASWGGEKEKGGGEVGRLDWT